MRVTIDANLCMGHGRCCDVEPELFGVDENGFGVVKIAQPDAELSARAVVAAQQCPERAIRLLHD